MFVFYIGALTFGVLTGWLLYDAFRTSKPADWRDWARDAALAAGALCVIVTAIKAMLS